MTQHEWDKAFNYVKLYGINANVILLGEIEARLKPLTIEDDYMIPIDRQYLDYVNTSMILNELRDELIVEKSKIDKS